MKALKKNNTFGANSRTNSVASLAVAAGAALTRS